MGRDPASSKIQKNINSNLRGFKQVQKSVKSRNQYKNVRILKYSKYVYEKSYLQQEDIQKQKIRNTPFETPKMRAITPPSTRIFESSTTSKYHCREVISKKKTKNLIPSSILMF